MLRQVMVLSLALLVACGGSGGNGSGSTSTPDVTQPGSPTTAPAGERDFVTLDLNTLIRVNPDEGTVTELGEVEGNVLAIAAGGGSVWLARDDGTVVRMSPATGAIEADINTGLTDPGAIIAFSDDGVFTLHGILGVANVVSMIDPVGNVAHHSVTGVDGGYILDIAAGEGAGWGIGSDGETVTALFRFDAVSGALDQFDVAVGGDDVATGGRYVWVGGLGFNTDLSTQGGVARFDPSTESVEFFAAGEEPASVLFAYDSVWVGDPLGTDGATLYRLDPESGEVTAAIPLGDRYAGAMPLYAGAGLVWVSTDDGLFVIEPENDSIAGEGDPPSTHDLLFP